MSIDETKQRMEFGGFNASSAFFGWLVATGVAALLIALLSAAGGATSLTQNATSLTNSLETVGLISGIMLLLALAVAYYAGGYVAGRMARFDGGRQGFGVWVMAIVLGVLMAIAGAALGSSFNLIQQLNLPHIPVNEGALTTGGLITLLLSLAVSLIAAMAGGKAGEAYHRRVDRAGAVDDDVDYYENKSIGTRTQPTFGERINRDDRRGDQR